MDVTRSSGRNGIAVAMLLSAVLMAALALCADRLDENHPRFDVGDHLVYMPMAQAPGEAHPKPYCYRKLVPTLASPTSMVTVVVIAVEKAK